VDGFRIANLIMQAVYLPVHLFFIIKLIKNRQPSPIWKWFIVIVVGLWGIIAGRLIESLLYLFWPNNIAYVIEVDYVLASTTLATMSFLFWNLYVAGYDRLADAKWFRHLFLFIALGVCAFFISNPIHHLFYANLELNGLKTHGKMFYFCVAIVYGMLFAGLIISIVHIIKHEDHKLKRIIVFSMYPILPGVTNLVRSITGVDRLDLNPIVISLSILCLYEIVFGESYVGVVSESIESVLKQTRTPIVLYNPKENIIIYENDAAMRVHESQILSLLPMLKGAEERVELGLENRIVRAVSNLDGDTGDCVITLTDITEIREQQDAIDRQIEKQRAVLKSLEEQKRNIEVYIEALDSIPNLREKKEMTDSVKEMIARAFAQMELNLEKALEKSDASREALEDNMRIAQVTITEIRKVVAILKGVS